MIVIVMGVSGAGKSTVGALLAAALGAAFIDGDDAHPKANIEKMRAGAPLDDADRLPWLRDLARTIDASRAEGADVVLACSALKARYRDVLAAGRTDVHFVHLTGDEALLRRRLEDRAGHFMPAGKGRIRIKKGPGDRPGPMKGYLGKPMVRRVGLLLLAEDDLARPGDDLGVGAGERIHDRLLHRGPG